MAFTDNYRRQHDEILDLAGQLAANLTVDKIKTNTDNVLNLLSQFSAKLNIHLTMEDKALYPKLLASSDKKISETATAFQTEMGGIKQVVEKYIGNWCSKANLQSDPQKFITDTNGLLGALKARVDKENTILYPMADKF